MARRFSVEAIFKAVDKVTAPVTRMQNRVGKLTRSMRNNFDKLNRSVNKFGQGIKRGAIAATVALALTSGAMANVIGAGAEFEQTLVAAAAKFPGEIRKGTEAFKQLEDAARKTGATTEFTATQSAQALNFLAMAGFDAKQSVAALPGVVDLATASSTDLATATDIATDALGAFGLMTKDTAQLQTNLTRVGDVLLKTSVTANATVEQLFESMKKAAPIATAAGVSMETVASLMGLMANSGIKAEKSGTAVANMFLNLTAPTSRAQKILRKLGLQLKNTDGSLRDVPALIDDLNKSMTTFSDPQKLAILEQLFGREGLAGVATVVSGGGKALRDYRKELEGATGAQSKMAKVMRDTLQGRLNSLTSAIEGVKLSIFSMTEGPLNDVVVRMTEWVRANEQLIASNIGGFISNIISNFSEIVVWLKRIGTALLVFVAFSTVLKTLIGILTLVNLVMAANPITLIVLGVLALIAAFTALVVWIDDIAAGFNKLPGIVQAVLAPIGLLINAIKFIKDNIGVIGDVASAVGTNVADFASDALDNTLGFFGMGGSQEPTPQPAAQMVSPQERVARSIEEKRSTSTAEVTIKDDTGRAEVTGGRLGRGVNLTPSGSF